MWCNSARLEALAQTNSNSPPSWPWPWEIVSKPVAVDEHICTGDGPVLGRSSQQEVLTVATAAVILPELEASFTVDRCIRVEFHFSLLAILGHQSGISVPMYKWLRVPEFKRLSRVNIARLRFELRCSDSPSSALCTTRMRANNRRKRILAGREHRKLREKGHLWNNEAHGSKDRALCWEPDSGLSHNGPR